MGKIWSACTSWPTVIYKISLIVGVSPDFGALEILECPRNSPGGVFGDVLGYDSDRPKLPALTSWLWIPKLPSLKNGKTKTFGGLLIFSVILTPKKNAGFLLKKKPAVFQGRISDLKHDMIT